MDENFTMLSGDKCDEAGYYWASGCGHPKAVMFMQNDEFPVCSECGKPLQWRHTKTLETRIPTDNPFRTNA